MAVLLSAAAVQGARPVWAAPDPLVPGAPAASRAEQPHPPQPQEAYRIKASRPLTAGETRVIELMRQSADARDNGHIQQATSLADEAVKLARETRMRDIQAAALLHLATLAQYRGDREAALRTLRQSQLLCEVEGNLACQANARLLIAEVQGQIGHPEQSQRESAISRALAQAAGDPTGVLNGDVQAIARSAGPGTRNTLVEGVLAQARAQGATIDEAFALRELGRAAQEAGDLAGAKAQLELALARARSSLNPQALADSLIALADLSIARHQPGEAAALLDEALVAAVRSGNKGTVGNALLRHASVALSTGDAERARDTGIRALAAFRDHAQLLGQGLAEQEIGNAEWALKRRAAAGRRFREAIRLASVTAHADNEAGARLRLAALLRSANPRAAMAEADRALALYKQAGLQSGVAATLLEQAWILGARNKLDSLLDKAQQSRRLYEQLRHPEGTARADYTLAVAFRMREQFTEAQAAAVRAVAGYRALGMRREEAQALVQQADILGRQGELSETDAALVRAQAIAAPRSAQLVEVLVGRSKVKNAQGDPQAARELAQEALAVARSSGDADRVRAAVRQLAVLDGGAR